MMLQLLISRFDPGLHKKKQVYPEAMLSTNEEYNNEQVTELESQKGQQ
jgi:hypothetical protein